MSSSQQPPDCALQLPSWDEFDQAEELDYSEHESVPEEEELHDPENENRSLPHANLNHEGASNNDDSPSVPNYEGHNSQDSSVTVFSLDQLPNSVPEYRDQPSSSRMIGI
ncbi:hypothetical protein AB6A40_007899 [Gnathostoma spinigerum]|uniref:Uncharacterized protein n=1 Tax=Gnathostoma spinigerum TaxID=75299 RepID=A0ABD6ENT9_9BILA